MIEIKELNDAYINGQWVGANKRFSVFNPATSQVLGEVADIDCALIDEIVDQAQAAFEFWSKNTVYERAAILQKWSALIKENREKIAEIMTLEQGKPLCEAIGEVNYGASYIDWFAEEAKRAYGDVIPHALNGKRYITIKQPVGVCAAITPWNFPIAMLARKVAPALAAGCTMIAKPSDETPYCALALAKLGELAGIPKGVFNVIPTKDAAGFGQKICDNSKVRLLTFTGSTNVGKILYAQSAKTMKKLALELGGNAPVIVFDDCDLDKAIEGALASKFRNGGQTCISANRILVQAGVYDEFVTRFSEKVKAMKLGNGLEKETNIGPLINNAAAAKVERLVNDAVSKGAILVTGGQRLEQGSCFFMPTVVKNVTTTMAVMQEEAFGPFAAIAKFETEAQAIQIANDVPVGLASYVFTNNINRVMRVVEALQFGIIGVNDGLPSTAIAPFGGVKDSGIGREGGHQGLEEYLDTKYICIGFSEKM